MQSEKNPSLKPLGFLGYCVVHFLLIPFALSLGAEEFQEGQEIRWSPIPNVSGYIVEVQDTNGQLLQRKQTTTSSVFLKLSPGTYQFRIIALNKFKKEGRTYPWKELIIRPISSPVVTSVPSKIEPTKEGFPVQGEFLHRGTRVIFRNSKGEEFVAEKVEPNREGTGIVVVPPENLPKDEYVVLFKNSKGTPYQSKIIVDSKLADTPSLEPPPEVLAKKEPPEVQTTKEPKKEVDLWPMFWRQALVPGWGHYYAGYEYTGAFYFTGSILLLGGVGSTFVSYNRARQAYSSAGNTYLVTNLLIQAGGGNNVALSFLNQSNLESSFQNASQKRNSAITAQYAFAGFYILSLLHVVYTAYTHEEDSRSYSFYFLGIPEQAMGREEGIHFSGRNGLFQKVGIEYRF